MDVCENEMNSQCVNSEGSFVCVCVPGYVVINGSCVRSKLRSICMGSIQSDYNIACLHDYYLMFNGI